MENVENFIINYFKKQTSLETIDLQNDYFDEKWIDSFGMIEMVEEIEKEFDIEFTQNDFKKLSFRKVNGLIDIIKDKINA